MYPRQLFDGSVRTAAQVPSEECEACHSDDIAQIVTVNGISIRHETCVAVDTRCTDCHSTVGHGDASRRRAFGTMDVCVECHDGQTASSDCDVCHTAPRDERRDDPSIWRVTHNENWRQTHGMGELSSCSVCHPAGYCSACHYDQPHPDRWPAQHGVAAKAADSIEERCLDCHRAAYCESCHVVDMPHPNDWRPLHMEVANGKDDPVCTACHTTADCIVCHELHLHPGRLHRYERR
jgi:hypothetical protein